MKLSNLKTSGTVIVNPNDRDIFDRYLREIAKFKPLSREEEENLFNEYKETKDPRIKDKICKHNLLFVVSVAKRYASWIPSTTITSVDLINEGNIGLCIAFDRFDNTSGNKFISYAIWWIRNSILTAIQHNFKTIRIPSNARILIKKIEVCEARLEQLKGGKTSPNELSDFLREEEDINLSPDAIEELLRMNSFEVSLNKELKPIDGNGNDELELIDLIKDNELLPDEQLEIKERKKVLNKLLLKLPEYVQNYLVDYYGLNGDTPMTLEEMSVKYDMNRVSISNSMDKYMRRLKCNNREVGKQLFPTPNYSVERQWKKSGEIIWKSEE